MADPLGRLVGEFSRLPGIGPKTATRLAHHLLRVSRDEAAALSQAILDIKDQLFHCGRCNAITAVDPCSICSDPERDRRRICVVEEPFNIPPIERTGEHRGLYHVLLGALSPQRGIGPRDLAIDALLERLEGVDEVILATNPDAEGDGTALAVARRLEGTGVRVSRLARGLPSGFSIEFAGTEVLSDALEGRRTCPPEEG